jgi:hypothetical protein
MAKKQPSGRSTKPITKRRVSVGDVLVVTRDSPDLGIGQGKKLHVVWVGGGLMDVDVPSLDMRIAGVRVGHPDVAPSGSTGRAAGAQIKREVEAALSGHPRSVRGVAVPRHGKGDLWQERMERVIWSQRPDGDRETPLSDEEIERLRADVLQSFEPRSKVKGKKSWLARKLFGA